MAKVIPDDQISTELPGKGFRFEFADWDDGRLHVNPKFADLLRQNGYTTVRALLTCTAGQVMREVGPRITRRIDMTGPCGPIQLYVKQHGRPHWRDWIKPLLNGGRPIFGARNEWDAILRFHAAGVPTMTPVAWGECDGQSVLVTEAIAEGRSLLDWLNGDTNNRSAAGSNGAVDDTRLLRPVINQVATIARRMHAAGLHHQDFYLNHLLYAGSLSAAAIRVIDLGRVRQKDKLSRRWIIKDLAQLDYSARRLPCRERLRFLRMYLGRPFDASDRRMVRKIVRKSQRIARHTRKNRL